MLQTTESMFKMNTKLRKGRFSLGNRFVNHRGGLISHIDDALHSYDKLRRRPVAPDVEGPALAAIIVACAKWLKAKRTKGKTGENFAARKACIDLLARDTYTRLQAINRVTQVSQFAYRKAIPQTRAPRSLHGGYAYERLMYLKQGKAYNPAAAGELKYQLEQIQGGLSSSKILSDHEKTLFNAMGAKTFGMLSYQDYLVLDKLATKSSLGGRKGVEVTFFSKASRMPYLVLYPDANGFLERAPATPLNTTAEPGGGLCTPLMSTATCLPRTQEP